MQEEAKRENVIRAPIAGIVTNIAVARGETVAENAPLATVCPRAAACMLELLVPTRAIGFVHPAQEVVLRYDAFPVPALRPVPRHGRAPSAARSGRRARRSARCWRASRSTASTCKLDKQTVTAGGQKLPLRPGMLVNADLLLEKRTVLEWVFEPVLALKGRFQ